jgi:arginine decarboxylase-like protein
MQCESCSSKAPWQNSGGVRSVTDVAASIEAIEVWSTALEETRCDAMRILEWHYEEISDLLDSTQEKLNSFAVLKAVGGVLCSTISFIF